MNSIFLWHIDPSVSAEPLALITFQRFCSEYWTKDYVSNTNFKKDAFELWSLWLVIDNIWMRCFCIWYWEGNTYSNKEPTWRFLWNWSLYAMNFWTHTYYSLQKCIWETNNNTDQTTKENDPLSVPKCIYFHFQVTLNSGTHAG